MRDTLVLMAVLQEAYPRYYAGKTKEQAQSAAALWQNLFAEDNATEVVAAAKAFIATDTRGFPPVIGQIKERLVKLKNPDMLDEAQAWALVSRAISKSAYHAAEAFEGLPPVAQKIVGSPGMLHTWAMTSADDLQTVVASNFQRAYRIRAKDAAEYLALPSDIRKILDSGCGVKQLQEAPDPEAQKQKAIALLMDNREQKQREMLGEQFNACKKEDWLRDM